MKNSKKIFILTEGILAILAAATALAMLGESNGSQAETGFRDYPGLG